MKSTVANSQVVCVRVMTPLDLGFADSLRALVGWNQTVKDWQRLIAHEPQGCFVAECDGAPAGTATTTCYGNELAWIGMVLVHPELRRRGIGRALLEHCLGYLRGRGIRCIKLDATPLGKELYQKLGFRDEWPWTRWETAGFDYEGCGPTAAERAHPGRSDTVGTRGSGTFSDLGAGQQRCGQDGRAPFAGAMRETPGAGIRSWQLSDSELLARLDSEAFGVSRLNMIERLARDSSTVLVHTSEAGRITGFGMLRPGARAVFLGPVVAVSADSGAALIQTLGASVVGQPVYWDIPDANAPAVELAKGSGFTPQRPLSRMVLGENRNSGQPQLQFAIADPAIG